MVKKYLFIVGLIFTAFFNINVGSIKAQTNRDIFTPPPGRQLQKNTAPTLPPVNGFDIPTTTTSSTAVTTTSSTITNYPTNGQDISWKSEPALSTYRPSSNNNDQQLDSFITWLPYLLIFIGAVGFAWGIRGQRRLTGQLKSVSNKTSLIRVPVTKPFLTKQPVQKKSFFATKSQLSPIRSLDIISPAKVVTNKQTKVKIVTPLNKNIAASAKNTKPLAVVKKVAKKVKGNTK